MLQEGPEPAAKVVDLMEALNASIAAAAQPGSEGKSAKRSPAAKRAPAKRAAPAKKAAKADQGARPVQDRRPPQGLLSTAVALRRRRLTGDPLATYCA